MRPKCHHVPRLGKQSGQFLCKQALFTFFEEMEDRSGIQERDFSCEIVDGGVFRVEEVGGPEIDTGSGTLEELLAEIEEGLFEVYRHDLVGTPGVSAVKDEFSDICAHYMLKEGEIARLLQQPKSTTVWPPFLAYSMT